MLSDPLIAPTSALHRLHSIAAHYERTVRRDELRLPCPVHKGTDDNLALWIDRTNPQRIAAYCHSHACPRSEIAKAIEEEAGIDALGDATLSGKESREVGRWEYRNRKGQTVDAVRRETRDGKERPFREPRGVKGPFLVRLWPRTGDGPWVLCEGEKDADAVAAAGMNAASYIGGAGQAGKAVYDPLQGQDVIYWPDDDEPGREAAVAVYAALEGIASSLRFVDMPGGETTAGAADFPAEVRRRMVREAQPWTPPALEDRGEKPIVPWDEEGLALALDGLNCKARFNERSLTIEFSYYGGPWMPQDERRDAKLRQEIGRQYRAPKGGFGPQPFKMAADTFRDLLNAHIDGHRVDPFLGDYLDKLPPWDRVPRIATLFQDMYGAEDSVLNQRAAWLILGVAVKRALQPGYKSDIITVLQGQSGIGKSAFGKALLPPKFQEDWFTDSIDLSLPTKELYQNTDGMVICEVGELAALSGARLAKFKQYITRTNDRGQRPYGRSADSSPRRFVLLATADIDEPLPNDPSGRNRRFLVVHLEHGCDVEAYMEQHRDQLWAEAYARIRDEGFDPRLPRQLFEQQERINAAYRDDDEEIEELVNLRLWEQRGHTLKEVRDALGITDDTKPMQMRIGQALKQSGWTKVKVGRSVSREMRMRPWHPPAERLSGDF